ncbi:MarR family transcriptional regulator [Curtobacterium sp. MCJR17_055]|uniref:MarR family winged helix-turn-helix transcriptional regulator n=1 Tax=unclassified Curtobacterium TaxID=257496 RepID=UPI000D85D20E|nr:MULTISPECIES: MarR family transcriptional regulator [unclassified Curtobacterium]PYY33475.1 MarR family transcriptional regulator [Curtobacterium sp. MCBD17_029]PYY45863.1 MarR family transcriptional regulator [Curtobacterium sp. MCBD17_023]PYY53311.1 MarR family transcriptional regulator [Curtobacterium sp. MCJR17_055]PYY57238.1 MarR family transcriptional regulator [Curtobacterium sp. MCPF17_015]PZE83278.1 MarR family transcriptional regulator [Curtobacterium sp. MCBD17_032]
MATDLELLGQMLKRAQYRNHRTMDAALRDVGVSLVQWDALRAVDRMPGASGHDLAVATFQSDQAFGTLATRLVERGLIERSAGLGRRLVHTLTDAGRAALDDGHAIAVHVLDELFAPLDDAGRRHLERALAALTAAE